MMPSPTTLDASLAATRGTTRRGLFLRLALFAVLGWFYVAAATQHATHVNWFKARADQSWFLGVAQRVHQNWVGAAPAEMLPRSIMPLYPAYLALSYAPGMSDDAFFEVAKAASIRLSVVLLAVLAIAFAWRLPPMVSTNLTLVVAFGYFIFKAGYVRPELLFYTLLFLTTLAAGCLLREDRSGPALALAAVAAILAALTYLTNVIVLPLLGIWLVAWAVGEIVRVRRAAASGGGALQASWSTVGWRAMAAAVFVSCFFLALLPYTVTSKRVFGSYFYNVNTTLYPWYDSWADAVNGTRAHDDTMRVPDMPDSEIPGPIKYFRTHSVRQVGKRLAGGFRNMLVRSYDTYWYLKYLAMYVLFGAALVSSNRRAFAALLRDEPAVSVFIALYALVFLTAAAFAYPVAPSGTSRFLIAHLTPLFFVLSLLSALPPFRDTGWAIAEVRVTTAHVHLLIFAIIVSDIVFTIYPRLMTTYGGF